MIGKNRERLLIILVLSCLGVLAADRLVIGPLTKLWKARSGTIAELRNSVQKGTQLLDREQSLADRWQDMRKRTPQKMSMTEKQVFDSVNNWAQSSKLTITSLKPRRIDEEDCSKLEVRLSATGDIDSIAHFLYTFETDKQAHKIEDIEMTARNDKGSELGLDLRFTGLVIEEKAK